MDEFDELVYSKCEIHNNFLSRIHGIKNKTIYVVNSFIGIGTFNILRFDTNKQILSPFNVTNAFHNPNFTKQQVRYIFEQFLKEYKDDRYQIDDSVIEEIYLHFE